MRQEPLRTRLQESRLSGRNSGLRIDEIDRLDGVGPAVGCFVQTHALELEVVAVGVGVLGRQNAKGDRGQILGRWHDIKDHGFVIGNRREHLAHGRIAGIDQKRVIPQVNDFTQGNRFDVTEIHDHAVGRIASTLDDLARQGDFEGVTVPVHVTALAAVIGDAVAGVKFQPASNAHDFWQIPG